MPNAIKNPKPRLPKRPQPPLSSPDAAAKVVNAAMLPTTWRQFRSGLPMLLAGAGGLLLCYVAIRYSVMQADQRRILQEWSGQNTSGMIYQSTDLTRLVIPRIDLDAVVVAGTERIIDGWARSHGRHSGSG